MYRPEPRAFYGYGWNDGYSPWNYGWAPGAYGADGLYLGYLGGDEDNMDGGGNEDGGDNGDGGRR